MKKLLLSALLVLSAHIFYCQTAQKVIHLTNEEWHAVLGGNSASPPLETEWGMAILTDGRMLNSCTEDGKVIWRRGTRSKPSFFTEKNGFFYLVAGGKYVTLVNASGKEIWRSAAPFEIVQKPVVADDGRIFVRGRNAVACFGNNGIRKWHRETPNLSDIPLFVLSDKSVLAFAADDSNSGQTVAKRFNAYGEEMTEVLFSNVVDTAVMCSRGILVAMKDGSMGLISDDKGKIGSPWIQKSYLPTSAFAIMENVSTGNCVFLFRTGVSTTGIIMRTHSGDFLNQIILPPLDRTAIEMSKTTYSGFFIADCENAFEFSEDGTIWWQAELPGKDKWSHLYYTKNNTLILCMRDWVIRGYKTVSPPKAVAYQPFDEELEEPPVVKKRNPLPIFGGNVPVSEIRAFTPQQFKDAEKMLKKGDFGIKEMVITEGLKTELSSYISEKIGGASTKYFAMNPDYIKSLFSLIPKIGIDDFSHYYATVIRCEKETVALSFIIDSAKKNAVDPNGDILTALEGLCRDAYFKDNNRILIGVCDAVFEICKYMGRPSLFKQGKEILKILASALYQSPVQDYAMQTLKRFADEQAL